MRDGLQHALRPGADVEVAPAGRRIRAAEIGAQHVADGQPQLAAGRGVADHRRDHVPTALERMHRADGGRFLPGPEPPLGDDARAHPALELNVVQPRAQESGVQPELGLDRKTSDHGGPFGIPLDRLPEAAHERGVRLPLDVLGRIERGKAPYFSFSLIFEKKLPAWDAVSASANSSAVV